MTQDNGATWTPLTVTAGWTSVAVPAATVTNPVLGFQIVTNGDAVDVDFVGHEVAAFASTPIPTTTVAVTRNADLLTYPAAGNFSTAQGSCYVEFLAPLNPNIGRIIADSALASIPFELGVNQVVITYDGTSAAQTLATASTSSVNKGAATWGSSTESVFLNGSNKVSAAFDGSMNMSTLAIGGATGDSANFYGTIRNVKIYSQMLLDSEVAAL